MRTIFVIMHIFIQTSIFLAVAWFSFGADSPVEFFKLAALSASFFFGAVLGVDFLVCNKKKPVEPI